MHSDRIVMWGMSCAGKTTFAKQLIEHKYYCFDALYPWHLIETMGLSISQALNFVKKQCIDEKFVLDGWNLSDKDGKYLPENTTVYIVYSTYNHIISQYRKKVYNSQEFKHMYQKWYDIPKNLKNPRFYLNQGSFLETSREDFERLINF